jgi:muramoyltetrapeptide carboxypeptidase
VVAFSAVAALRAQDRVAVVAPSGSFDRPSFEAGLTIIASRYRPVVGEHVFETHRYLAGDDAMRLSDLQRALDDDSVRAIFTARGGYGLARLLPRLRLDTRKPIIGFSDVTALHLAAQSRGFRSLHAPVLTQLGRSAPAVAARLFDALEGRALAPLHGLRTVVPGVAEGVLLGGNLSVLTRLIGTQWLPSLRGAVLLLEDVGERPYRLDRMLTHLAQTGLLAEVAAIGLGELTSCEEKDADYSSAQVVDELLRPLGVPVLAGLPVGHGDVNWPLPLGARVRLDATGKTLECLEGLT